MVMMLGSGAGCEQESDAIAAANPTNLTNLTNRTNLTNLRTRRTRRTHEPTTVTPAPASIPRGASALEAASGCSYRARARALRGARQRDRPTPSEIVQAAVAVETVCR